MLLLVTQELSEIRILLRVVKLIQHVLKSIQEEQQNSGFEDNWTLIPGQVAACYNDHSSRMSNSVSPFKAIFGLEYLSPAKVSLAYLHQCQTI
jgi:hypothetical protein